MLDPRHGRTRNRVHIERVIEKPTNQECHQVMLEHGKPPDSMPIFDRISHSSAIFTSLSNSSWNCGDIVVIAGIIPRESQACHRAWYLDKIMVKQSQLCPVNHWLVAGVAQPTTASVFAMMQAMVSRSEQAMTDFRDDQIDFERVVTDPEYRRHVIVFLNAQARGPKSYRAEVATYPLLRRLG